MDRTACTEPQCLYSRAIPLLPLWAVRPVQSLSACTVELNLYSPYWPYCLYRASVPLQYSYTWTPLLAVRPVQSLSACTVQLHLYSPYGPYSLYRASVPVQYSYTSTPLWAVRPVQSLSACTVQLYLYSPYGLYGLYRASVPVQYSYTSTPTMGRTACTEPQCLYKGALFFYIILQVCYTLCLVISQLLIQPYLLRSSVASPIFNCWEFNIIFVHGKHILRKPSTINNFKFLTLAQYSSGIKI